MLSSSTHPGSGAMGGQLTEGWGNSIQEQKRALQQVLEMGLHGITLTGVPACGTRDDASELMYSEHNYVNSLMIQMIE